MRCTEIAEIAWTAAIFLWDCLDHLLYSRTPLRNLTLCAFANCFRIELNYFICRCSANIEDCLCKRQRLALVYLLYLFSGTVINSHADTITAIKTEIFGFFFVRCIQTWRKVHSRTNHGFIPPCNTSTCDKHSPATPQFSTVAFTQNYKEAADGTHPHFLLIWKYLSTEQGQDKRVTCHVQLLKWHQQ